MRQFSTLLTGLVFDMDGVLVDSEPCWYEAMVRVLNRRGAPLSIEDCRRTSGTPIGLLVEQYQGRWPAAVPAASRSAVVEEILSALRDTLSQRRPLVRGTLEALRFLTGHGVTLALASSSPITGSTTSTASISASLRISAMRNCSCLKRPSSDR